MTDSKALVKGHLLIEVRGPDGEVKDVREEDNTITTNGKYAITDLLLASPTLAKPTHMEVGTGTGAEGVGNTTITGGTKVALTSKTRSTNVLTMVGDWAAGSATATLTEAGVWDNAGTPVLLARVLFGSSIAKGASDTLKITWTWTVG